MSNNKQSREKFKEKKKTNQKVNKKSKWKKTSARSEEEQIESEYSEYQSMVTDVDNNINEQKDIIMKKNTKQGKKW